MALNLSTNRVKRKFTLTTMTLAVFALVAQPLVALNIPAAFATGSETLYVDTSGDNRRDCKDSSSPCRTVSKAVENANAGDTISVGAGTYVENVTINKSLKITGNSSANVSGQIKAESGAQDIEISGLGISNVSAPAIKVPSGVSLNSLKLQALSLNAYKAIYIADGSNSTISTLDITNSTITSNYPVYIDHAVASATITGNTFQTENGNRGLVMSKQASSATVNISGNTFNMGTGVDAGTMNFVKYEPANSTILNTIKTNNQFKNNNSAVATAVNGAAIVMAGEPKVTNVDAYFRADPTYTAIGVDFKTVDVTDATGIELRVNRVGGGTYSIFATPELVNAINAQASPTSNSGPIVIAGSRTSDSWTNQTGTWTGSALPESVDVIVTFDDKDPVSLRDSTISTNKATWSQVLVDKTPPTFEITNLSEGQLVGTANTNKLTIKGTLTDPSGARALLQLVKPGVGVVATNVTANSPIENGTLAEFSTAGLASGAYELHIRPTDYKGNAIPFYVIHFKLDTVFPSSFAINTPTNGSIVSGTQTITAEVSDANDIKKLQFSLAGMTTRTWEVGKANSHVTRDGNEFSITLDTTTLGDGVKKMTLRAIDGAGNVRYWNNSTPLHTFTVDNTAPKPSDVTISTMKNIGGTNFTSSILGNDYLTVRFKTDEPLKLAGSQIGFQIPGMAGPPATGWTPVSLVDATTNTYEAKISLVNRTNTNVPGYEGFFNDKYFEGVKLYFRMVDSLNNVDSVYYYADGTFGKSPSKAYAFTLDNKVPEVSKAELYKNGDRVAKVKAGDTVNVKVTASDTASGVDTVVASVYTCPGGNTKRLMPNTRVEMTHVGDGVYELNGIEIPVYYYDHKGDLTSTSTEGGACVVVYATDKAGNEKQAATLYFSVDNTAPSITKYSYSNDGKVTPNDVTVTIETSEPVDTPDDWDKVDSTHFTKVFTQNGGFEVTLTDEAGNTATVGGKSQGAEVKGIDKVAPVFNIENEEVFNTSPVLVSVAENNLKTVTVNGDAVTSFLRNKPYEFDVTGDGVYEVVATDKANHKSTVTFTIDTTPPTLSDVEVSGTGNERIISGTTEPGAKVSLLVNGTIYELVASENGSWSQLIDVSTFTYGVAYPYFVYAEDAHGNKSDTQTGNIVVPNPGARSGLSRNDENTLNFQASRATVAATPGQLTAPAVDAEQDIRGAQDVAKAGSDTAVLAASDQGWKLFGAAWYWWLLAVAALAGAWWFIAGLRRRRQAEETL